ncbi:MAG TPA: ATP-grasp domain-containing protein [Pyrinomonadaceae bacterium]
MRVLVLDGNENQAVACVRSLARAGHAVSVGAHTSWSKAGWSRGCRSTFAYPAPQEDADAFVRSVVSEAGREPGTLVMPMTERTTLPLSARRAEIFGAGGRLVLPSHETVLRAFDKQETTRLAASLGVVVPQTVTLCDEAEAAEFARTAHYPLVLKPRTSEEVSSAGRVRATGAPVYARDASEFIEAFRELRNRCSAALVQEFVEGAGVGYFALMREGELRAEFAHRRIRDVRPTGSGSAVRESARPSPRVREAALAVLSALNWHGVAMVEFRLRADGTPVFLEVNGRFWNSLPLAVYAGVDFPALLAELAEHGDTRAPGDYRAGVRCRWMLGDFRHLLEVMRGAPAGYTGEFPARGRALLDFLRPVAGTYHDNFMLGDPLPELGDWLDFALRKLPAGLRQRTEERKALDAQGNYSLP